VSPTEENQSDRFEQLPATPSQRRVPERPTRADVLELFAERFGISPSVFDAHTFWEKGAGKVWAYSGAAPSPLRIETLGMSILRTRQEHWKPTTNAAQRFGTHASRNVIELSERAATRFLAGEDQEIDWDGDWGYLIAAHELAGEREPIGVGLYLHGELRSRVPKSRRRTL